MNRSMHSRSNPKVRLQPLDCFGKAVLKPPLKGRKPIARSRGCGAIKTASTQDSTALAYVGHWGETIISTALRAGATFARLQQLRRNARSLENLNPPTSGKFLELCDGDRIVIVISMGVVVHATPPCLFSSSLGRYRREPPILCDGIFLLAVNLSTVDLLHPSNSAAA
jgi:hypothetical protein